MTRCIQLESRIFVPGFDSDWKVIYGEVTVCLTSRQSSISNCKSNFCFSILSLIWRASSKTGSAQFFNLFQNKLWQIGFFFWILERKFQNSEIQLPLFDLGTKVPKRIVKS